MNGSETHWGRLRVAPGAVLPLAVGAWGVLVALALARVLHETGGHFVYTLDDPYIHLALARRIAEGHYGINASEPSAPSSSVLWPFLLAPLAPVAVGLYLPFVLNVVLAALTLVALNGVLRRLLGGPSGDKAPGLRLLLLVLAVAALNLLGLTFNGMEHVLQVFLTVVAVSGMAEAATGRRVPWWTFAALAAGPFVRYENLALTLPALLFLFARGERRASLVSLLVVGAGLGAFSAALLSAGLGPMPSSILAKQTTAVHGLDKTLFQIRLALQGVRCRLLLAITLPLLVSVLSTKRTRAERALASIAVVTVCLHILAGRFNDRYEMYAVAVVGILLLTLHRSALLALWNRWPLATLAALSGVAGAAAAPAVHDSVRVPLAARNVYEQQVQMGRFVAEYYPYPVVINDLGYVAYRSPSFVVDVAGLASLDAIRMRREDLTGEWMDTLARAHDADLAMIYDLWFPQHSGRWVRLGTLHLGSPNAVLGDSLVAFYATRPEARPKLEAALRAFRPTLPPGVTFTSDPPDTLRHGPSGAELAPPPQTP